MPVLRIGLITLMRTILDSGPRVYTGGHARQDSRAAREPHHLAWAAPHRPAPGRRRGTRLTERGDLRAGAAPAASRAQSAPCPRDRLAGAGSAGRERHGVTPRAER